MLRISEVEAELLKALCELRYLTLGQIQTLWFSDRVGQGARIRLSRMCGEGLLKQEVLHRVPGCIFRLTLDGVRFLREKRDGNFEVYGDLQQLFLKHLLATNDVFLALAGDEWRFDDLPFEWVGSHRAHIKFVELAGGDLVSSFHRRNRLLVPDAIVTPRAQRSQPRCFVELDRSTELIHECPGHPSIIGKLKTYRTFLGRPQPGSTVTAYRALFQEDHPARVVFVVATKDRAERRLRSITAAVKQNAPDLDVRVVALADIAGLRVACLGDATGRRVDAAPVCQKKAVELTSASLQQLIDFHVGAAPVLERVQFANSDERARLISLYAGARDVLLRLRDQGVGR